MRIVEFFLCLRKTLNQIKNIIKNIIEKPGIIVQLNQLKPLVHSRTGRPK